MLLVPVAPDGQRESRNVAEWEDLISEFFAQKWGANRLDDIARDRDFMRISLGAPLRVEFKEVEAALKNVKQLSVLDAHGECVAMWKMMWWADPSAVIRHLEEVATSWDGFAAFLVNARVQGKSSSRTLLADCRTVMPLPARAALIDFIIAARLQRFLDVHLPRHPAVWEGARPRTQMLDISHGLSLVVEKAVDLGSRGALSQCDVLSYYDSVDVVDTLRWMVARGLDLPTAAAAARSQLLPRLVLKCGEAVVEMPPRSRGALTGSRVAGQCGRVPVVCSLVAACRDARVRGWQMDGDEWTFSSFVDNVFSQASDANQAMTNCEVFEQHLRRDWRLNVKPKSCMVMPVRGSQDVAAERWHWRVVHPFPCLGVLIDDDGGCRSDLHACEDSMRKSLYRNCCGKAMKKLPVRLQQRHVDRMLRPLLLFRASRWPVGDSASSTIDRLQKKFLRMGVRCDREPGDSADEFFRRRGLSAKHAASRHGLWSDAHRSRVRDWRAHLLRERNFPSPASRLVRWHGEAWRRERRIAAGSLSAEAGRLASRILTHVWPRWDESRV